VHCALAQRASSTRVQGAREYWSTRQALRLTAPALGLGLTMRRCCHRAAPAPSANYSEPRRCFLCVRIAGQWNERDAPTEYAAALRAAVASQAELNTTVLNRLPHYPGTGSAADASSCKQYEWNSTDGSRWVDEEGSIFDGRSARSEWPGVCCVARVCLCVSVACVCCVCCMRVLQRVACCVC
jgi:hypothetical protein